MKHPTHLQYIETLGNAQQLSRSLKNIRLALNHKGDPIFSSGNFGTVFKITIGEQTKALKCFTRDQPNRTNSYRLIANGLKPSPPYIIPYQFLDNELSVFDGQTLNQFPALLMDWVDGETMTTYLRRAVINHNKEALQQLATRFDALAHWLLNSEIAHGDLKPDNIMVRPDASLTLVDYDGIYTPTMKGSPQRELGTAEYQHPLRQTAKFDKSIDHYSLAVVSLTLHTLTLDISQFNDLFTYQGYIFNPTLAVNHNDQNLNTLQNLAPQHLQPLIQTLASQTPHVENIHEAIPIFEPQPKITHHQTKQILTPYKEYDKYGFVNQYNAIIIPAQFDAVQDFSENLAPICINKLWGYVNEQGIITIPPIYHYAAPFTEGLAAVALNNRFGYIQPSGQSITTLKFDNAWSFHNGRGLVQKNDKYGFVDPTGKTIIPVKFQFARSFNENIACVQQQNLYGYIDTDGQWIIKPQFSFASSIRNGVAKVEIDNAISFIEVCE